MEKNIKPIERFKEIIQDDKFWEELEKRESKITKFYERYIKKIMALSKKEREALVQKIIDKYDSDAYVRREYRLGYQPRECLFDILYYWAANYGKETEDEGEDDYFPIERYIVDDNIKVYFIVK